MVPVIWLIDKTPNSLCVLARWQSILYLVFLTRYSGYIDSFSSQLCITQSGDYNTMIFCYISASRDDSIPYLVYSKFVPIPFSRFNCKLHISKFRFQSLAEVYSQTLGGDWAIQRRRSAKRSHLQRGVQRKYPGVESRGNACTLRY